MSLDIEKKAAAMEAKAEILEAVVVQDNHFLSKIDVPAVDSEAHTRYT